MPSRVFVRRVGPVTRCLFVVAVGACATARGEDSPGIFREELVHRWDLDGNGTIDESEAAIARSRMRRKRLEIEAQSGIDPLTGRPRSVAMEPAAPVAEPAVEPPPPPPRKRTSDEPPLPGTRVPEVKRPTEPRDSPPPSSPQQTGPRGREPTPQREGSAQRAPPTSRSGPLTGGVRAGAPAARPGYGAQAPAANPNPGGGRLAPSATPAAATRPETGRMSGGLVPRPLVPTSPGASLRGGGNAGRPLVTPRPAPPVPTLPRPPRVTAEDIGGG